MQRQTHRLIRERFGEWRAFHTENAHLLRRDDAHLLTQASLLQLAAAHADTSPVAGSAERWIEATGSEVHISVPARTRQGLGTHLSQVAAEFLTYMKSPESIPAWERPNMLAKYFVTTTGVQMSQAG